MVRKLIQSLGKTLKNLVGLETSTDQTAPPAEPEAAGRKRPRKRKRTKKHDPGLAEDGSPLAASGPEPWDPALFDVPLEDGKLRFQDLGLPAEILHAVFDLGFRYCTPIQAGILPSTLQGKDASGKAQTGTGKTAAFLISVFTHILRNEAPPRGQTASPRALVLAPTRELAIQIGEEAKTLSKHTSLRTMVVFGGMDYERQKRDLKKQAVDVLVATPGRLLDFHRQKDLTLNQVEILVIDEADRMLDMGFVPDVRQIIHCTPQKTRRQTLLFSATLPPDVIRLASQWTRDPIQVEIEPEHVATDSITQLVYITTADDKRALLYNLIVKQNLERVIVFCNRRDETRRVTEFLERYSINCAMISGEIPQNKRLKTLESFKSGEIRVLVATDVAGRGLHIEGISHVVNYTLPHDPEDYVHRIGRTGRAGATGTSVSFACEDDSFYLPAIETFLGDKLPCIYPEDAWLILPPAPKRQHVPKESTDGEEKNRPPQRRSPSRPGSSGSRGPRRPRRP